MFAPNFFAPALNAAIPSRPKALSGANVAIFTSFFAIAAAPAIASCEELLPVLKIYLFQFFPVILSATAGSTTIIFSYSSASGKTANVSLELDDPTKKSTFSSSNNFVAFLTATSAFVSVSSTTNLIFFPSTFPVPPVA
ncbi:Uncharacterised protein [Streptococcus pneumoniae]|nr:Uncharacterised protein [Streptococcus pneumoniae]CJI17760.1 Uncharacterised protein [Streptococcus pneumoniae]CKI42670.1 Uncharacterised protein [Streptococcus pneumoniae]